MRWNYWVIHWLVVYFVKGIWWPMAVPNSFTSFWPFISCYELCFITYRKRDVLCRFSSFSATLFQFFQDFLPFHSNLNYCIVYIICQFLSSFFVVRVTLVFIGRYGSVIHKITNFSIFGWEKKSKCNGRNIELYGTPSKVSVYKMLTLLS